MAPPAIALVVLGLPLYWWADSAADVERARTLFTTFAVFCGLALLPLLHPPVGQPPDAADTRAARCPSVDPGRRRCSLVYGLFFVIAPLRDFFQLTPLSWQDVAVTARADGHLGRAGPGPVARPLYDRVMARGRMPFAAGTGVSRPPEPQERRRAGQLQRALHVRHAREDPLPESVQAGVDLA